MTAAPMDVRQWVDTDDTSGENTVVPPETYVKVAGHLRSFQNKKSLVAFKIMPLEDMNEFTTHILEVVNAHMMLSKPSTQVKHSCFSQNYEFLCMVVHACNPTVWTVCSEAPRRAAEVMERSGSCGRGRGADSVCSVGGADRSDVWVRDKRGGEGFTKDSWVRGLSSRMKQIWRVKSRTVVQTSPRRRCHLGIQCAGDCIRLDLAGEGRLEGELWRSFLCW
ncbi:PREDICTED: replication protein A 32 kDa subunit isoform X3 [Chinchilla lanigera]|nr:PREDICTED: replication protein A 32 kDa subunit isoform X3 [Chinchilla lanigera]